MPVLDLGVELSIDSGRYSVEVAKVTRWILVPLYLFCSFYLSTEAVAGVYQFSLFMKAKSPKRYCVSQKNTFSSVQFSWCSVNTPIARHAFRKKRKDRNWDRRVSTQLVD